MRHFITKHYHSCITYLFIPHKNASQKYENSSRFVKRELRSLTEADREKFLNAAIVMWQYNTSAGLAKYGESYTSIEKFVAVHSLASNDIMCDSFHEGVCKHKGSSNLFMGVTRAVLFCFNVQNPLRSNQ